MEKEVKIRGLLVDPTTSSPVVLLKAVSGDLILPIWVGPFEATAIASEIEKKSTQRPMTHDLLKNVITQSNGTVEKIIITSLQEGTFYAAIYLRLEGNQTLVIDSRPSDAIALALRCDCPMFIKNEVFDLSKVADTSFYSDGDLEEDEVEWPEEIEGK